MTILLCSGLVGLALMSGGNLSFHDTAITNATAPVSARPTVVDETVPVSWDNEYNNGYPVSSKQETNIALPVYVDLFSTPTTVNDTGDGSDGDTINTNPTYSDMISNSGAFLCDTFGSFSFKGVGINVVKSIIRWDAFGMNIVLPITTNFPRYDRVLHYPKVGCRFGVAYPCMLRLSITVSLPTHVIASMLRKQAAEQRITKSREIANTKDNTASIGSITAKKKSAPKRKVSATDSVRRLGLQLTFTYDQVRGLRSMVGPTISYLPGVRVLELLKPAMLLLPTVVVFAFNMLTQGVYKWLSWCIRYIVRQVLQQFSRVWHKASNTTADDSTLQKMPALSDIEFPNYRKTWHKLSAWMRTKTPAFACNLGYFTTASDRSMGSNLVFELQPFFPLHKHLARLKSAPLFHYASHRAANTVAAVIEPPDVSAAAVVMQDVYSMVREHAQNGTVDGASIYTCDEVSTVCSARTETAVQNSRELRAQFSMSTGVAT